MSDVVDESLIVLAASLGRRVWSFLGGAAVVFALAWLAQVLAAHAGIKSYGLEYVIFALGLGLLWSHLLPVPGWLSSAVSTEFFIKTGIVILGAGMLFGDLMKAGAPGLIQAVLVIPVVWHFTFRLARKLKVDDEFGVIFSTAVSICGVSAAFVCIGLETRLGNLAKLGGGRPALAFLGGQAVNVLWTLLLAWLLFGVLAR